jgi:hypothetical protein
LGFQWLAPRLTESCRNGRGRPRRCLHNRQRQAQAARPRKKILDIGNSVLSSTSRNHPESDMTLKTALVALVLGLAPALAWAHCGDHIRTTASNCGEGQVWDEASQTCITPQTS